MAARFWVGGTGTWDGSDTTHWAASSGGASGVSVPGAADTVTFDGSSGGGTVTVNTTVNVTSITMGAFTGTLDFSVNNNNVSLVTFNGAGTGTRTLKMGNGTWTITPTAGATSWDMSTTTNLTFQCNGSTLVFAGTAGHALNLGALTYNNVTFNAQTTAAGCQVAGAATISRLAINAPNFLQFAFATTITLSNAPTWSGTASQPILLENTTYVNLQATFAISAGAPSLSWCALRGIAFTGTTGTAINSLNVGGNSGITITPPAAGTITYASLPRGLYYPEPIHPSAGIANTGPGALNAATLKYALMGRIFMQGRASGAKTISAAGGGSITVFLGTTTFANAGTTMDVGFQDMNATGPPAKPDGTFDVKATFTGGVAALTSSAWNTFSMTGGTGTKSITHGDQIAIVFDMTARGGADTISVLAGNCGFNTFDSNHTQGHAIPGFEYFSGGAWGTAAGVYAPIVVITFDDGTLATIDPVWPTGAISTENYSDSTNPDERGLIFQVPFDCKVDAIVGSLELDAASSDFTATIYATPLGTPSALVTVTVDADQATTGLFFDGNMALNFAEVALTANTDYVVAVKSTVAGGTLALSKRTLGNQSWRALHEGGTTVAKATRNNSSGAFTVESPAVSRYALGVRISSVGSSTIATGSGGLLGNANKRANMQ